MLLPQQFSYSQVRLSHKVGTPPCSCSLHLDLLCHLPSPACCQRCATAHTHAEQCALVPRLLQEGRARRSLGHAVCLPVCPLPSPHVLFSNSALGEQQRTSSSIALLPRAALCPWLWQCQQQRWAMAADPLWPWVPLAQGLASCRNSQKGQPETPASSHTIWSNQSET